MNPRDPHRDFDPDDFDPAHFDPAHLASERDELDPMQLDGREEVPIHELFDEEERATAGAFLDSRSLDPDWFLELHELLGEADSDLGLPAGYSARDAARVRELLARLNDDPEAAARFRAYRRSVALLHGLGREEAGDDGGTELRDRILAAVTAGAEGSYHGSGRAPSIWLALSASIGFAAAASLLFMVLLGEIPDTFAPTREVSSLPETVRDHRPGVAYKPEPRALGGAKEGAGPVLRDKRLEKQEGKVESEKVTELADNKRPKTEARTTYGSRKDVSGKPSSGLEAPSGGKLREHEQKGAFGRDDRGGRTRQGAKVVDNTEVAEKDRGALLRLKSGMEPVTKAARDRNGVAPGRRISTPVGLGGGPGGGAARQRRDGDESKVRTVVEHLEEERDKSADLRAGEKSSRRAKADDVADAFRAQAQHWRAPALTAYRFELTPHRATLLQAGLTAMSSVELGKPAALGGLLARFEQKSKAKPLQGFTASAQDLVLLRVRGSQTQVRAMLTKLESSEPRSVLSSVQISGQDAFQIARAPAGRSFVKLDDQRIAAALGLSPGFADRLRPGERLALGEGTRAAPPRLGKAGGEPVPNPEESQNRGKNEKRGYSDLAQRQEQARKSQNKSSGRAPERVANSPATKARPSQPAKAAKVPSSQRPADRERAGQETLDREVAQVDERQRDNYAKPGRVPTAGGGAAPRPAGPATGGPTTPGKRSLGPSGSGRAKLAAPQENAKKSAGPGGAAEIEIYLILERQRTASDNAGPRSGVRQRR